MTADSGARGIDLRGAPRVTLELVVRLRFDTGGKHRTAITANVSATGMYVRALDPPPIGALAQFELDLPGRRTPVRGSGEVVWIRVRPAGPDRPPGLGIHFRHVEAEALHALERAIEQARRESPPGEAEAAWHSPPPRPPRRALPPDPDPELALDPPVRPSVPQPPSRPAAGPRPAAKRPRTKSKPSAEVSPTGAGTSPRQMAILAALLLILLFLLTRLA